MWSDPDTDLRRARSPIRSHGRRASEPPQTGSGRPDWSPNRFRPAEVAPEVIDLCSSLSRLLSFAAQYGGDGSNHEQQIKPERDIAHVLQVGRDSSRPGSTVAVLDLCQSGETGSDAQAATLLGRVPLNL